MDLASNVVLNEMKGGEAVVTSTHRLVRERAYDDLTFTCIIKCLKDPSDHSTYFNIFSLCPTIPVLLLLVNSNALFLILLLTPFTSFTSTVLLEFGTLFLLSISHYLPQPSRN